MTWMTVIPVMKLLPVYMLIMMSLRRIPSWGQGNDPEKMTILLTCSVNLRALKIADHCSPFKSLRYLLYHLLKRLLNLLPSDFVLLMFEVLNSRKFKLISRFFTSSDLDFRFMQDDL